MCRVGDASSCRRVLGLIWRILQYGSHPKERNLRESYTLMIRQLADYPIQKISFRYSKQQTKGYEI